MITKSLEDLTKLPEKRNILRKSKHRNRPLLPKKTLSLEKINKTLSEPNKLIPENYRHSTYLNNRQAIGISHEISQMRLTNSDLNHVKMKNNENSLNFKQGNNTNHYQKSSKSLYKANRSSHRNNNNNNHSNNSISGTHKTPSSIKNRRGSQRTLIKEFYEEDLYSLLMGVSIIANNYYYQPTLSYIIDL